ncbi:MAG: hypothetical protein WDO06_05875 [Actinomycetota bacterium]
MIIDCASCVVRDIACSDCVVTAFLDMPTVKRELPEETMEAIELLSSRGLIAPMRFKGAVQG